MHLMFKLNIANKNEASSNNYKTSLIAGA